MVKYDIMTILNFNNEDSSIENNYLIHNKNIYKINIDYGEIKLGSTDYVLIMENSHIGLINQEQVEKNYFFTECLFYMNSSIINIGRLVYNLSDCNFRITRGRILINNNFYNFTFIDNKFTIINYLSQINNDFINNINESNTNVKNILINERNITPLLEIKQDPERLPITELLEIVQDKQNVHRPDILEHFVDKFYFLENRFINTLKLNMDTINYQIMIMEIKDYINILKNKFSYYNKFLYLCNCKTNSNKSLFEYDIIKKVLKIIFKNNGFIYRFLQTELYILSIVWYNCTNDDLKNILLNNLYDMYNFINQDTYCITGRVTRMLNTFEGIIFDNNNKIDILVFRPEMLNKCAIIRNQNNNINDEELKKIIIDTLYKDYVSTNLLSEDLFNQEINSWINDI